MEAYLYYILLIMSFISVFIQIVIIIVNKYYKSFLFENILIFFLFSLLNIISLFINFSPTEEDTLCYIQGFMIVLFELAQYLYGTIISHCIYRSVYNSKHSSTKIKSILKRIRIIYFLIGFGIPIVFNLITYYTDMIGISGEYCWIELSLIDDLIIKEYIFLVAYFIIIWLSIIFNFIFVKRTIQLIRDNNEHDEDINNLVQEYYKRLIIYPVICTIIITFAFIIRVLNYYHEKWNWLRLVVSIFSCLQGFFFSIAYGYFNNFKKNFGITFYKIFRCCHSPINNNKNNLLNDEVTENHLYITDNDEIFSDNSFRDSLKRRSKNIEIEL